MDYRYLKLFGAMDWLNDPTLLDESLNPPDIPVNIPDPTQPVWKEEDVLTLSDFPLDPPSPSGPMLQSWDPDPPHPMNLVYIYRELFPKKVVPLRLHYLTMEIHTSHDFLSPDDPETIITQPGREQYWFPRLVKFRNPCRAVAAIAEGYMKKPAPYFTIAQKGAIDTLRSLMAFDETISDPDWPSSEALDLYFKAVDDFIFGGLIRPNAKVYAVKSHDSRLGLSFGKTYFPQGQKHYSEIFVDDHQRDFELMERYPKVKRWTFLGCLIHEMCHVLIGLYTCRCNRCMEGYGHQGHGFAWQRVARAANAMFGAFVPRGIPALVPNPDDVGLFVTHYENEPKYDPLRIPEF